MYTRIYNSYSVYNQLACFCDIFVHSNISDRGERTHRGAAEHRLRGADDARDGVTQGVKLRYPVLALVLKKHIRRVRGGKKQEAPQCNKCHIKGKDAYITHS